MTGIMSAAGPPQQGPDAAQLGEQIRENVQRALEEAARATEQAEAAQARAAAAAQGVPLERGAAFRVDENGNIIPLEPGGAATVATAQPAPVIVDTGPPPEAMAVAIAFFVMIAVIIVGLPIARAIARRMDRQAAVPPQLAVEQAERIARIEHAVDAMAIEVERISEGQRFVTKLLTERALPEGQVAGGPGVRQADPLPVGGERR